MGCSCVSARHHICFDQIHAGITLLLLLLLPPPPLCHSCVHVCISYPLDTIPCIPSYIGRLVILCSAFCPKLLHQLVGCVVMVAATMYRREVSRAVHADRCSTPQTSSPQPLAASAAATPATPVAFSALISALATLPLALSCISRTRSRRRDPSLKVAAFALIFVSACQYVFGVSLVCNCIDFDAFLSSF